MAATTPSPGCSRSAGPASISTPTGDGVPAPLDALGRELYLSLGCGLEHLVLAARARGLAPPVTLLLGGPTGDHVAQTGLPGVGIHWMTGTAEKAAIGELIVDAAIAITADAQQSKDSFDWFRSTDDAIQRHRDGLTLDGQGLAPLVLTAAKLLPASSRGSGDAFRIDQTRAVHTRTAAAYGVLTVIDPDDAAGRLLGGRLLQRGHLTATAQGVALQHMNQITERIDRERATHATPTFAPRFAQLLALCSACWPALCRPPSARQCHDGWAPRMLRSSWGC